MLYHGAFRTVGKCGDDREQTGNYGDDFARETAGWICDYEKPSGPGGTRSGRGQSEIRYGGEKSGDRLPGFEAVPSGKQRQRPAGLVKFRRVARQKVFQNEDNK